MSEGDVQERADALLGDALATSVAGFALYAPVPGPGGTVEDLELAHMRPSVGRDGVTPALPPGMVGQRLSELVGRWTVPEIAVALLGVARTGRSWRSQVDLRGRAQLEQVLDLFAVRRDGFVVVSWYDATDQVAAAEALVRSHELLAGVIDGAGVLVFELDLDGRFRVLEGGCASWGDRTHRSVFERHADEPEVIDAVRRAYAGERSTVVARLGQQRWSATFRPRVDERGTVVAVVGVAVDVTEQHAARVALAESEARFRGLAETAPDVIYRVRMRPVHALEYVSPAVEPVLGFPPDVLHAHPELFLRHTHPQDRESLWRLHLTGSEEPLQLRWRHPDGRVLWMEHRVRATRDADGEVEVVQGIARDITRLKAVESDLAFRATHDLVTGLDNRAGLLAHLQGSLERAVAPLRPAVLLCDLDRFKVVNEALGHDAGDALLCEVGRRLRAEVRPGDRVARLGGDEFVLLLDAVADATEAVQAAERVRAAMRAPLSVAGHEVVVAVSIGVALAGRDDAAEDVLRHADSAAYRAKAAGGDRWELFDQAQRVEVASRLQDEADLRAAIEQGQLVVHYQPEVDLLRGEVVGAEALVRWAHPERGLLAPGAFIGLAEESGLIVPLGRTVLRDACARLAAWQAEPATAGLLLRVNLSARQLSDPGVVDAVAEALAGSGADADGLSLEVTESVVMREPEQGLELLRGLRALGVHLAVDDFGTGYSSFAYLKRFPVDGLKVDKSFVDGLGEDEEDRAIVAAVVTMAETLGLSVTAEGVETATQARVLAELGCRHAQGWLFSAAVEAARFPDAVRACEAALAELRRP